MTTTTRNWILALAVAGVVSCAHDRAAPEAAAQTQPAPARASTDATHAASAMSRVCPMDVPGTQVSASDTATGAAVTFQTTPDQVPALRERVRAMADMHEKHHAARAGGGVRGHGGGAMGGPHGAHGHGGVAMPPPSRAAAEDVEGGARVVVTPADPADLEKLRSTIRAHAAHLQQHGCAMGAAPSAR